MGDKVEVKDIEGLRSSGTELAATGTEIAGLAPQASEVDDYAQAMASSAVANTASDINTYFTGLLTAHSRWPVQLGGNVLAALSSITGQDEASAAGLKS